MAAYYWDTSALLPLLFREAQTGKLLRLANRKNALPGFTSFFSLMEVESAFHRRLSDGSIFPKDFAELRISLQTLESALSLIWPDAELLSEGRRCVQDLGLKPGDAMQLCSAKSIARERKDLQFVCLDRQLNRAAKAAGMRVWWTGN